jgi:hypothetical protein
MTVSWVNEPMYRVSIKEQGVHVMNFDITDMDVNLDTHYNRVDDLPNWVKERLALLLMTSPTPPTDPIDGVGRRVSETVFWVLAPSQGERNE